MKKVLILLFVALLGGVPVLAEEEVLVSKDGTTNSGSGDGGSGRSSVPIPLVWMNDAVLLATYPLDAVSVVQIVDKATDAIVYSGSFGAMRLVVINLEEEGLTTGNYRLRIFVFGEWWRGEFEIAN